MSALIGAAGRNRWRTLVVGVGVLVALAFVVIPALGDHPTASLQGSNFEIDDDANLRVDDVGNLDWANVKFLSRTDKATGRNDDSYSGGVKEDTVCPGETTGSIPNNKSDLLSFGIWEEPGDPGFVHIFWLRVQEPSGTTLMDFEFNQSSTPCPQGPNVVRTAGDLLLEYRIEQGGARAAIFLREWTGTAWGASKEITSSGEATGTINSSAIPFGESAGLIEEGEISPRTFGEASISLDAIFDKGSCKSFGSVMLKSRASTSFTSQLKDFILPLGISISNCGSLTVEKVTEGGVGEFNFTTTAETEDGEVDPFDLTTTAAGTEGRDSKEIEGVLAADGVTITETVPAGWKLTDVACTADGTSIEGAWDPDGEEPATATVDVGVDVDVTCTFTNTKLGSITVVKETDPSGSVQEFDFAADWDDDGFTLSDGDTESSGFLDPDDYNVTETVPDGWTLTDVSCVLTGTTTTAGTENIKDGITVTLAAGQDVTCTFTNTKLGSITVVKETDPSGSVQEFDFAADWDDDGFTLSDGETESSGFLDPDDYNVTETVPDGWTLTDVSCVLTGTTTTAGTENIKDGITVDLAAGQDVTCTFTNTKLGSITIEKVTEGGFGAFDFTGPADTFTIETTTAGTAASNEDSTFEDLLPDGYTFTETTLPDGWDLTDISCTGGTVTFGEDDGVEFGTGDTSVTVTLAAGEDVTCTFTNTIEFKVIVLVCRADGTLVASEASDGVDTINTPVASGIGNLDESDLCALAGFGGKDDGEVVDIDVKVNQPKALALAD